MLAFATGALKTPGHERAAVRRERLNRILKCPPKNSQSVRARNNSWLAYRHPWARMRAEVSLSFSHQAAANNEPYGPPEHAQVAHGVTVTHGP